jgi:peptide deformylase
MKETMDSVDGAWTGRATSRRVEAYFVFRRGDDVHAIINPRIVRRSGERKAGSEGCLSIPACKPKCRVTSV